MIIQKVKVFLLFFIIIILCFSCALSVEYNTEVNIVNTETILSYLTKANDFLIFIIYLLESNKIFWLNIYSRLYYFYFTLARVKSILQKKKLLKNDHKEIWRLNKKMPRKIFGKEFREIRNDSDYNIIENIDKFINETNVKIINNHKMTLEEQLNDIMEYIKTIKQIDFESVNESITEIKNNHIKIIKLINKK